ncbi:MAG TPA: YciI family protein [Gemmatimonadaceae bacterium]|nr:YciI family protein [Gemmatimonadaceae bacterium]
MKFMLLIYNDDSLLDALPTGQADAMMRDCFVHADELRQDGRLLDSQQLEDARTAKSVRIRGGRVTATDGPFSEAKEVLGGFNIIEAADMEEAVRIAAEFPWASTGCVEVRPIRDMDAVRRRVGAPAARAARTPAR